MIQKRLLPCDLAEFAAQGLLSAEQLEKLEAFYAEKQLRQLKKLRKWLLFGLLTLALLLGCFGIYLLAGKFWNDIPPAGRIGVSALPFACALAFGAWVLWQKRGLAAREWGAVLIAGGAAILLAVVRCNTVWNWTAGDLMTEILIMILPLVYLFDATMLALLASAFGCILIGWESVFNMPLAVSAFLLPYLGYRVSRGAAAAPRRAQWCQLALFALALTAGIDFICTGKPGLSGNLLFALLASLCALAGVVSEGKKNLFRILGELSCAVYCTAAGVAVFWADAEPPGPVSALPVRTLWFCGIALLLWLILAGVSLKKRREYAALAGFLLLPPLAVFAPFAFLFLLLALFQALRWIAAGLREKSPAATCGGILLLAAQGSAHFFYDSGGVVTRGVIFLGCAAAAIAVAVVIWRRFQREAR